MLKKWLAVNTCFRYKPVTSTFTLKSLLIIFYSTTHIIEGVNTMEPWRWNSKLIELLASSAGADADAMAGADALIAGGGLGARELETVWKHATTTPKLSKLPFAQSLHRGGNREIAALAS
jgi:hypothetical protein